MPRGKVAHKIWVVFTILGARCQLYQTFPIIRHRVMTDNLLDDCEMIVTLVKKRLGDDIDDPKLHALHREMWMWNFFITRIKAPSRLTSLERAFLFMHMCGGQTIGALEASIIRFMGLEKTWKFSYATTIQTLRQGRCQQDVWEYVACYKRIIACFRAAV
jgi:hypothetical protein